jgi:hypothetical protein
LSSSREPSGVKFHEWMSVNQAVRQLNSLIRVGYIPGRGQTPKSEPAADMLLQQLPAHFWVQLILRHHWV